MANKDFVMALKIAKRDLHRFGFICNALPGSRFRKQDNFTPALQDAGDMLRELIMSRLEGQATVDGWLISKVGVPQRLLYKHITEYRIRWLNSLIKEFSK